MEDREAREAAERRVGRAAFMSPETRSLDLPDALALELGGYLPSVCVGYRTWGTLDAAGSNAVVVCHALTGSADADRWWTAMFGPGRALDPEQDFILHTADYKTGGTQVIGDGIAATPPPAILRALADVVIPSDDRYLRLLTVAAVGASRSPR